MKKRIVKSVLAGNKLNVVDVGCAFGPVKGLNSILEEINFLGFDPFSEGERLSWKGKDRLNSCKIVEKAVFDSESEAEFFVTKKSACSSLLKPNFSILEKLGVQEKFQIEKKLNVKTTTIDKCTSSFDFLKVDVQGAARHVLEGAVLGLESSLLVEVESEFYPLYHGQDTANSLISWMEKKGYLLVEFSDLKYFPGGFRRNSTYLSYADLLFVNHELISSASESQLRKLLAIGLLLEVLQIAKLAHNLLKNRGVDLPRSVESYLLYGAYKERFSRRANLRW